MTDKSPIPAASAASGGIPITDPEELAWCDFADHREKRGRPIAMGEQSVSIASFKAGAAWERAACAEMMRQAGCVCAELADTRATWTAVRFGPFASSTQEVDIHDPRCPLALAAAIEVRGRE